MKILYLLRPNVEKLPPVMSQLFALSEDGHDVTVVTTTASTYIQELFKDTSVKFHSLINAKVERNNAHKIVNILLYRKLVQNSIKENPESVVWIGSVDTAVYCRDLLPKKAKTIFNIFELYDKYPHVLRRIKKVAQHADVVIVPEYNRAHILKVWLELNKTPIVIPNKPYFSESTADVKTLEIAKRLTDEEKKIILYQGWISEERDISLIAEAINTMEEKEEYLLVLMGPLSGEKTYKKIKEKCPNLIHIPYLDPPQHLYITEKAYIGIASYDDSSLNTIFCAPNKIYEYAMKRVPMLARNIPGLVYTVENSDVGVCVNTYDVQDIIRGIRLIDANYAYYQSNMDGFLMKSEVKEKLREIICQIQ